MTRYRNSVLKQLQDITVEALKIAIENLKRERDEAVKEATLCGAGKPSEKI